MTFLVPPTQIIASGHTSNIFTKKMMDVLRAQGQIEPLQVREYAVDSQTGLQVYITYACDPYGAEIVDAARIMEWPTLLCTFTNNGKYEY